MDFIREISKKQLKEWYLILQMTQLEHDIGYNVEITNGDLVDNKLK